MKEKILITGMLLGVLCFCSGCFQANSSDCNYRTVPVTNNTNEIPKGSFGPRPF